MSGAAWSWKVRKSSIWLVLAEVHGLEVAGGAAADEVAVGAGAGVVAAERGLGRGERGVGVDPAELRGDLPDCEDRGTAR